MYDALGKASPGQLTENSLTAYYKDARLGVADADTAGVVGVRGIDWQNRPTFQQVVKFQTHRG